MAVFDERELEVVGQYNMPGIYGAPDFVVPKYSRPVTPKENMVRMLDGKMPLWVPNHIRESVAVQPMVMPDAYARAYGGTDWFGIEWEYEPLTAAAMVKPGTRRLSEITEWKNELKFPDLKEIDWQKDYEENYRPRMSEDLFSYFIIVNGLFERTADLTSFEDTFCYLLEEPEALEEFYDVLTDWHIELMTIAHEVYHVDMILMHDDMGTQKSTFFSPALYEEMFVPHYKKITKACHDMGMYTCLHSCGNISTLMPYIIDSGWDAWEGQDNANDKAAIMREYGKDLAQFSLLAVPEELDDEQALAHIHKTVDEVAATGRYACRVKDTRPGRKVDLADELYRYSRVKYMDLAEGR